MRLMHLAAILCFLDLTATAASPAQTQPPTRPSTQPSPNAAVVWMTRFERDPDGFTQFPPADDARIIRVSSSEGSDQADWRLQPVQTLKRAIALARPGYPDQILFRRGDIFTAEQLNNVIQHGGRNFDQPMVVGVYGNPKLPRPVLQAMLSLGGRQSPSYLVLQSLDFYAASRDPTYRGFDANRIADRQTAGINMNATCTGLWIEDCRVRYFNDNIVLQSPHDQPCHVLVLRRCQICDSWNSHGHSQGLYLQSFDHVLIEENLFDHNGYNDLVSGAAKTVFNHNMYLQHGQQVGQDMRFIVRGNISARASSHGCQLRPGGLLENNLFLKNPLAAFVAYAPSIVRDNVVLDGDSIGPTQPRGHGLEFLDCATVLAQGNIIAHKTDPANSLSAMSFDPTKPGPPPVDSVGEFAGNIVYDWVGPAFSTHSPSQGLLLHDNIFQEVQGPLMQLLLWKDGFEAGRNHYASSLPRPFIIAGQEMDLAAWCARTGETPGPPVTFVDPSRDIASYAATIGLDPPTLETFLQAATNQRRGHWDKRLTADAVNRYIRQGFASKPER